MRIWGKIKINDIVIYHNEKYIVEDIYQEESTTFAVIKNINNNQLNNVPLYSCKKVSEK